jgi:hypothetical protein
MGPYVDPPRHECQEQFRFSYETHQENKSLEGPPQSRITEFASRGKAAMVHAPIQDALQGEIL